MSVADALAPQLPFLRRFARALTGSQASGDSYVSALLEALIADPTTFVESNGSRVEPFRLLCKLWNSVSINQEKNPPSDHWELSANRKLEAIPAPARQAFLLVSVEEFTIDETAKVMEISPEEVRSLLNNASREISEQVKTEILIIEDEPIIALDIENLVTDLGHDVTGIARTHQEAVKLASEKKPGMVLADIHLADGSSGIEAVNDILKEFSVPVIFITAFPERLLTGERPEPAFLITKPFLPDMVKAVISQALFFEQTSKNRS